jgi:hypothetical protein
MASLVTANWVPSASGAWGGADEVQPASTGSKNAKYFVFMILHPTARGSSFGGLL